MSGKVREWASVWYGIVSYHIVGVCVCGARESLLLSLSKQSVFVSVSVSVSESKRDSLALSHSDYWLSFL